MEAPHLPSASSELWMISTDRVSADWPSISSESEITTSTKNVYYKEKLAPCHLQRSANQIGFLDLEGCRKGANFRSDSPYKDKVVMRKPNLSGERSEELNESSLMSAEFLNAAMDCRIEGWPMVKHIFAEQELRQASSKNGKAKSTFKRLDDGRCNGGAVDWKRDQRPGANKIVLDPVFKRTTEHDHVRA